MEQQEIMLYMEQVKILEWQMNMTNVEDTHW
jgi:hypothetical protein